MRVFAATVQIVETCVVEGCGVEALVSVVGAVAEQESVVAVKALELFAVE